MPDEDLIITVDSLDEPVDHAADQSPPGARRQRNQQQDRPERTEPRITIKDGAGNDDVVTDLKDQLKRLEESDADKTRRLRAAEQTAARSLEDATAARQEVEAARTTVASTRASSLDSEIASANSEAEAAGAALSAALSAGEHDKVPALQRKISRAEARVAIAEEKKSSLADDAPVTRTHEGRAERQEDTPRRQQREPVDQFEAVLARTSPRTRAWLEAHPEYVTDPLKAAEASLAHERAIKAGHKPDSDAYFRFAEQDLGLSKTMNNRDTGDDRQSRNGNGEQAPARRSKVAAAPVDRGGGGGDGSGGGGEEVSLTKGEVANATDGTIVWNTGPKQGQPIGVAEMARRKLILQKDGRYMSSATQ